MAKVKIQGNASGTGVLTVTAPNTSTDRTITLPDSTGTLATTADVPSSITDNGDATAITINSSEQVGIGTSNPSRALHVKSGVGTAQIESTGSSSTLYFGDSASSSVDNQGVGSAGNNITFIAGGAEKARILSSGGITFNGDLGTSNALDDYEEGSWTPALRGGTTTGSPTYWSRNGTYTKIGRQVHIQGGVHVNSLVDLDGIIYITGLPFAAQAQSHTINFSYGGGMNITAGTYIAGYTSSNGTEFVIRNWDISGGTTNLDDAELSGGAQVIFSGSYFI